MQINFRTEARPASKPHTDSTRTPHGPRADTPRRHSAPAEGTARRFITPQNAAAGQRRNRTKENRVADIYNAVSVRSEADSNRCTRFCRPLPSHSAIRPFFLETPPSAFPSSTSGTLSSPQAPSPAPPGLSQPPWPFSGPLRISLGHPSEHLRVVSVRKYTHFSDICKTYSQLYAFSASNPSVFARKSLPLSPAKESPRP